MQIDRVLTILIAQASDLPGVWTAQCLELNVITQGTSIDDALRMAQEAVDLTVDDDLAHGLNPFDRGMAPDEDWDLFVRVWRRAVPLASMQRARVRHVIAKLQVRRGSSLGAASAWEEPAFQLAA